MKDNSTPLADIEKRVLLQLVDLTVSAHGDIAVGLWDVSLEDVKAAMKALVKLGYVKQTDEQERDTLSNVLGPAPAFYRLTKSGSQRVDLLRRARATS